jgi:hypothetical protein
MIGIEDINSIGFGSSKKPPGKFQQEFSTYKPLTYTPSFGCDEI